MDTLTEFRRELIKSLHGISDDDFLTKQEVQTLINTAYGTAKRRAEGPKDEALSLEDE